MGYVNSDRFYKMERCTRHFYTNIKNGTKRLWTVDAVKYSETRFIGFSKDVTEHSRAEEALRQSEEKYRRLVTQMLQGLAVHEIILDETGKPVDYRYLDVNQGFENLTGLKREDVIGKTVLEIMPGTEKYWIEKYGRVVLTGEPLIYENYSRELGKYYEVVAYPLQSKQFAVIFSDITERKKAEDNLIYLNIHDHMTGLYNRRFFENEAKKLDKSDMLPLSIILGDINGVKLINDALGHAEGDRLIIETAKIIQACCRKGDVLARTGGDEFTILLPKTDAEATYKLIGKIQTACAAHNAKLTNEAHFINISLGYGTKTTIEDTFEKTLKTAENYMYQRKLLEHQSSHSAIIASIRATMLEKNQETEEHSERLIALSKKLGEALNLSQKSWINWSCWQRCMISGRWVYLNVFCLSRVSSARLNGLK